jgi:replication factor A2
MQVQVTVVAQVTQVQQQATNCVYQLDDGSGRIEARQWMNADTDSSIQDGLK